MLMIGAVLTAAPSGGASYGAYLTYLAGVAAAIDNKVIEKEWLRNASEDFNNQYGAYYDAWNIAYTAINVANAGIGAYSLINNLRHLNTVKSIKAFHSQYRQSKLFEVLNESKGGIKEAAKGVAGTKLLNQFNSAESLIQGAGKLTKVKAGMQGFVKGDESFYF